ncbi:uncharacterized protein LOC134657143 [Cydia amplana]|uniref:uncharacterized protein LOC134657143 n=1 Tax=Cydia amplana TaxID=1869771 RepID=UPI002FE6A2D3
MDVKILEKLPHEGFYKFRRDQLNLVRKTSNMDDTEGIRQAIELLRNWMQKQEYFNKKDQSDTYLEKNLVVSKGSLERSKIRLEKICTLRTIWPMHFTLKDLSYFTEDFKTYNSVHLRDVTEDGSRVSLSKVYDTKTLTSDLLIRFVTYAVITCEYAMAHDYPNGLVAILDFQDVNLIDLLAFSTRHFTLLQQCLTILKEGYGMRLRGLHVLTTSKATDALVTFAKQLLPKKLADRLHVHRDMDTLYNFVPKEILPSDLGGDAPRLSELHGKNQTDKLALHKGVFYSGTMEIKAIEQLPTDGYFKFNQDQLKIVRKTCNMEDPGRIKQGAEILRDWLQKQEYFNKKDYSDAFFEKMLVTNKGSVERAKSRYEKQCTLKTIWPQYFIPTDLNSFRNDFELFQSLLLPDVTEECCRVSLSIINDNVTLTADLLIRFTKFIVSICEYAIAHDYPNGFVIILDHRLINLLELLAFVTRHFTLLQHSFTIMLEGYGMRVKAIHVITPSKAADTLVTLLKQLLTAKMASRIHLHKDVETLFAHVPKKIFPAELGGESPPLIEMQENFLQALCTKEHEEWMKEAQGATINESKKPQDYYNNDAIGMPGSFRSLSVD